MILMK